jgi:hypothetical protein|tara:strand:- start:274 stop:516 length:243 start_codon:yes stop_codon:yes gene_type:complete
MKPRNYKHEYDTYHGKPEQRKRRSARNKARSLLIKKGVAKKGDGKDVDHKDRNPLNNSPNNLRIQSKTKNRGWRKGKNGY